MALGLFFTFVSLFVISFTSRKDEEDNITTKLNQAMMDDENQPKEALDNIEELGVKKSAREMHVFAVTPATVHFQGLMTCAAIYYAMLLTNWGNPVYLNKNFSQFLPADQTSYWC